MTNPIRYDVDARTEFDALDEESQERLTALAERWSRADDKAHCARKDAEKEL